MLITVSACERASEPDTSGDIELGVQTDDIQNIDAQQSDDGSLNSADDTDEKTETNPAENDSTEKTIQKTTIPKTIPNPKKPLMAAMMMKIK